MNRAVERAFAQRQPRGRSRYPKILYASQVAVEPPTVIVFVNDRKLFDLEYERYLANRLREEFDFGEVPLRIVFRDRHA